MELKILLIGSLVHQLLPDPMIAPLNPPVPFPITAAVPISKKHVIVSGTIAKGNKPVPPIINKVIVEVNH